MYLYLSVIIQPTVILIPFSFVASLAFVSLQFGPRAIIRGSRKVKLQLQPKAAATAAKGRRHCGQRRYCRQSRHRGNTATAIDSVDLFRAGRRSAKHGSALDLVVGRAHRHSSERAATAAKATWRLLNSGDHGQACA